jgi:hypothetical protein
MAKYTFLGLQGYIFFAAAYFIGTLLCPNLHHYSSAVSILYVVAFFEKDQQRLRNVGYKSINQQSSIPKGSQKEIKILS